jgi:hypothetical protein
MSRLFWVSVGAVGGFYVARRGERMVAEARERGVVGNVTLAASTATKAAAGATRAAAALGETVRARTGSAPVPAPVPGPAPDSPARPTTSTREARP